MRAVAMSILSSKHSQNQATVNINCDSKKKNIERQCSQYTNKQIVFTYIIN